jgi:hypothetical protein
VFYNFHDILLRAVAANAVDRSGDRGLSRNSAVSTGSNSIT